MAIQLCPILGGRGKISTPTSLIYNEKDGETALSNTGGWWEGEE